MEKRFRPVKPSGLLGSRRANAALLHEDLRVGRFGPPFS